MKFLACYVFQYCDMSSFRPAPVWAIKLQANCCSFVPLAVLGGVDEQSVLTGEAIEKIGHCCQDTGKATEDPCKIRQAVLKPHGCTSSTLQSALKMGSNYLVMLTDGTFLLCFHYISIQMSPDEALELFVRFLWVLLQDTWLCKKSAFSTHDSSVQPYYCCCVNVFPGFLIPPLLGVKELRRRRHLIIQLWSRNSFTSQQEVL